MPAAILVIDLVNDTFEHDSRLARAARAMLPRLNDFLARARARGHMIIFSTDSFLEGDFLFGGRMGPHSLRGTKGAQVAAELNREPGDTWLPKRRFSAFFKTDLDQTLRLAGVRTVAVAGVSTHFCVLATVLDALAHDFEAVFLEDLCIAPSEKMHQSTLDNYRRNPLEPLLRVMTGEELLESLAE